MGIPCTWFQHTVAQPPEVDALALCQAAEAAYPFVSLHPADSGSRSCQDASSASLRLHKKQNKHIRISGRTDGAAGNNVASCLTYFRIQPAGCAAGDSTLSLTLGMVCAVPRRHQRGHGQGLHSLLPIRGRRRVRDDQAAELRTLFPSQKKKIFPDHVGFFSETHKSSISIRCMCDTACRCNVAVSCVKRATVIASFLPLFVG